MRKIIAGIDASSAASAVCDAAAWSSQRLDTEVMALHVLEKSLYPSESDLSGNLGLGAQEQLLEELAELDHRRSKLMLEQGKLQLQAARERLEQAGATAVTTRQRHGSLVETLVDLADELRLLVIGRHGEEHANELDAVGSQLESVIRVVRQPILITQDEFRAPQRFLLAYDGSGTAQAALDRVAESPLLTGLPCVLVCVGKPGNTESTDLEAAKNTLAAAGIPTEVVRVESTEVARTLCEQVETHQADLVVMGTHGHSRIRKFFVGSTSTAMLRRNPVMTLLLR